MKQDIVFCIIFFILLFKRDHRLAVVAGLLSLLISIPLFATWIFFTAQRLTWYAGMFFLLASVLSWKKRNNEDRH